jgi:GNAT superfamily N-acetyltransferase
MIQTLTRSDWDAFIRMADAEGWQVPLQEQRLFINQWRPYFFVLKIQGKPLGFVSAVCYRTSGWIGNLLIHPQHRGQGYGTQLLRYALAFLDQPYVKRVWLTASDQGAPLYLKYGFETVDRIERWSAPGLGQNIKVNNDLDDLIFLDSHCWQESREPLIRNIAIDTPVLRHGSSLALLQPGLASWQLGPWLIRDLNPRDLHLLLQRAREMTPVGKTLVSDILTSAELELILRANNFVRSGTTKLMCLSQTPASYSGVIALASLGSIG